MLARPFLIVLLLDGLTATAGLPEVVLTHGVAVGEVSDRSVVLWARSNRPATLVVAFAPEGGPERTERAESAEARDFTSRIELSGLAPGTRYRYRVRFEVGDDVSQTAEGSFGTAPSASQKAPVRFIVSGDLGGHGYCREEGVGYRIFERMRELEPDFFVANGDMIYADSDCPIERPGGGRNVPGDFPRIDDPAVDWTDFDAVREIYLAHWRYNRADPHFQKFLLQVPVYVQWDDHEVINDFGAPWPKWSAAAERKGYPVLVRAGREALFDFHPLRPPPDDAYRIYRSFRWGRDAELFLLDARSYRSENEMIDSPANRKTLLGRAQLGWLERRLAGSDATWKIVSTDVPLSIPTGTRAEVYGHDGFADGNPSGDSPRTGFESELGELLSFLDAKDVENVVFVATDVHFATSLRYDVDADGDGDRLLFHELVCGPLSAALMPPAPPDPTFGPQALYVEGGFFNFELVRIERDEAGVSHLLATVRDDEGRVRPGSTLELTARK